MYLFSFWYGYVMIQEQPKKQESKEWEAKHADGFTASPPFCTRLMDFLRDFFDFKHIQETFRVAFKEGENMRKKRVILLMVVVMVVIGPMHGEMTVMYLFTRLRFNWNEVDFSIFSTYSMIINLVGTVISVGLFSHMLRWDDAIIGIMSCMSKILAGFLFAFATTTWMIYLAPIVDMVNGTSFIAMRSIASKLVPPDELGKVNSLVGVCEALMPLVYGPMYSSLYQATITTLPGAFFLLGGALTAPAVVIFGWMYTVHRKENKAKAAAEEAEKANKDAEKGSGAAQTEGFDNLAFDAADEKPKKVSSGGPTLLDVPTVQSTNNSLANLTTGDVILRASWREKTYSGVNGVNNNGSVCPAAGPDNRVREDAGAGP